MSSAENKKHSQSALGLSSIGTGSLLVPQLFDVKGWVAVVTGGGTGLGFVTAAALAENGAKVYITGRRQEMLDIAAREASPKSGPGKVIPIQADVATKDGILSGWALRDAVAKEEKYINLLVNNHGVSLGRPSPDNVDQTPEALSKEMFENESFERWAEAYQINTTSYYFNTWAFVPLLAAAKSVGGAAEPGNVLNIASISGITKTSQRGQMSYNASKAATISLNDQLATELARRGVGIRVNAICPGYFPSGMSVFPADALEDPASHHDLWRNQMGIPFARPGNAVDYVQTVFGVIVNQYQTGSHIVVDGGWLLEQAF